MAEAKKNPDYEYELTMPIVSDPQTNKDYITVYLKEIDEKTYKAASRMIQQKEEIQAAQVIIANLCVKGDDIMKLDQKQRFIALRSSLGVLAQLVAGPEATLKKK